MREFARRIAKVTCMFLMICSLCACGGDSKMIADFESLTEAVTAFENKEAVEGKTVLVTATMDSLSGVIYQAPDLTINANISVCLVIDEATQEDILTYEEAEKLISPDHPILNVKEGETVLVKIGQISSMSEYAYFVYGTLEDKSN